jgi:amino acid adenylation domain-containing protein
VTTDRTMYEWFHDSARAFPGYPALRVGGVDFTYDELVTASTRVAGDILDRSRGRPKRIGFLAPRNAATYLSYLAGLRLGITVVPLNPEVPAARNADIVRLAGIDILLHAECDEALASAVHEATGVPLLEVSDERPGRPGTGLPAPHRADPDELVYIVFTSGSTGTPKGVPIRQRNASVWLSHVLRDFDDGPDVRLSQTSDLHWDLSVFNIFLAWGAGGTVVVPTRTDQLTPSRHINADEITHWVSTPSVITMARLLGDLEPGSMPTLRWSIFAGELLTVENALTWKEAAPNSVVANLYGPTEATCTCLMYPLPDRPSDWPRVAHGAVPMGPSYPTVESIVVGEDGRESDEGELLVRGPQRFDGYLDPAHDVGRFAYCEGGGFRVYDGVEELTDRHWYRTGDRVRVEPQGYAFLGRLDNQVKVHGYRIELGDVEAALRRHRFVDEAVVVPCVAEDGATELAGFYTGRRDHGDRLPDFLAGHLPAYMIPRFLVWLDKLPLTTNGKVDRKGLAKDAIALADAQQQETRHRLAS